MNHSMNHHRIQTLRNLGSCLRTCHKLFWSLQHQPCRQGHIAQMWSSHLCTTSWYIYTYGKQAGHNCYLCFTNQKILMCTLAPSKYNPSKLTPFTKAQYFFKLLGSPQQPCIVHKLLQSTNCYNIEVYVLFIYTFKIKHRSSCQNVFISTALIVFAKIH